jgi:hypothetical protein
MKAKQWLSLTLALTLSVAVVTAEAADKKKGGLVGNSYASQMEQISDTSIRITTRKKVSGTMDEINTPGTTTYKAFQQIQSATMVRAALEAKNLGFAAVKAGGVRDLTKTISKRVSKGLDGAGTTTSLDSSGNKTSTNTCPGGICESDFTFAQGHYGSDVELAIEVTFDMFKEMPADPTGYTDVNQVLVQAGLADVVTK